ncbi:pentapeptide repeat-containing protein [Nocardia salmonicida]|uniref:pentapeptide repeat-containing protein n=1 Tax=Nocardia salmonicida TaxID=53431 RepID=UPI0037A5C1E7
MFGWVNALGAKARTMTPSVWAPISKGNRKIGRLARRMGLFPAVMCALVAGILVAGGAYQVVHRITPIGEAKAAPIDITRVSLTIVAGVGGVVALVIAYRRQRDVEQSRFVERFGAAAAQLGATDVAVRIAGVYAMAGVADESDGFRRQQCIDVLCGYLRLPYSPELGANHQSKLVLKHHRSIADGTRADDQEHHLEYRHNDREVRATIVRVVADHLRSHDEYSWSASDFDFRTAHLEDVDLSRAVFSGAARFDKAMFTGATRFDETTFIGATFVEAIFSGNATFDNTTFTSDATFKKATFTGAAGFHKATFFRHASFDETTFTGTARFSGTTFTAASFIRTTFSGAAWFDETKFNSDALFFKATFTGVAGFDKATFKGVSGFYEAMFTGATGFNGTTFTGDAMFEKATFTGDVWFEKATFTGDATFNDTTFTRAWFTETAFTGNARFGGAAFVSEVSFATAKFGSGGIFFNDPRQWGPPPPIFDWADDGAGKPENVEPQEWPPAVAPE